MAFSSLKPMLRTWDIPATIAFYSQVLGFKVVAFEPEWGWAHLVRDGVELMLSAPNTHEGDTEPKFTGSLYFICDDVDLLFDNVREHSRLCYPIEDFPYGMREFAIYDNNGYLLQFGHPLN